MHEATGRIPSKWLAFFVISLGTYNVCLDIGVINIALPEFTQVFNAGPNVVLWIWLVYLLMGIGLMLPIGRAADAAGYKRLFVSGNLIFLVGLALSPLSQSLAQLLGFRVLQSLGTASIVALGTGMVVAIFPPGEKGKGVGILLAVVGAGLMTGPVVGGFLLDHLGWRSLFWARLPLAVAGAALAWAALREERPAGPRGPFDLWGSVTLFVGLTSFLLAINQGGERGWLSPLVLAFSGAVVASFLLFLQVERRAAQPVVDLALFRSRTFSAATWSHMLIYVPTNSVSFLMPFYLIQGVGLPSGTAGLVLITFPLTMVLTGPVSGWLSDRVGNFGLCIGGPALACVGLFFLSRLQVDSSLMAVVLWLAVMGVGSGFFVTPNTSTIMGSVPQSRLGTASAMVGTMRQVGMSIGLALAGVIFVSRQGAHAVRLSGQGVAAEEAQRLALVNGFDDAVLVALGLGFLSLLVSLLRRRQEAAA